MILRAVSIMAVANAVALAQPYEITWSTIDGGGGSLAGGPYTLTGTIGQPDAGAPLAAGPFELAGGFWPGVFRSPPCQADTNGDGFLDNGDIGTFISLFLAGNSAADFNSDTFLDNGDISAFIAAFLAGC